MYQQLFAQKSLGKKQFCPNNVPALGDKAVLHDMAPVELFSLVLALLPL